VLLENEPTGRLSFEWPRVDRKRGKDSGSEGRYGFRQVGVFEGFGGRNDRTDYMPEKSPPVHLLEVSKMIVGGTLAV